MFNVYDFVILATVENGAETRYSIVRSIKDAFEDISSVSSVTVYRRVDRLIEKGFVTVKKKKDAHGKEKALISISQRGSDKLHKILVGINRI